MFRRCFLLRLIKKESAEKFKNTTFNNATEVLAAYHELLAPLLKLRDDRIKIEHENGHLEWDIGQNKAISNEQRSAREVRLAINQEQLAKIDEDINRSSKALDTAVFAKCFEYLARDMPVGVYKVAEDIGTEMNELKIPSSPAVMASLRKIYFGDEGTTNSELLFRFVERPASMFILTGNVQQMKQKLADVFEERGSQQFAGRQLDRSKFEPMNEADNERHLLAQLELQK